MRRWFLLGAVIVGVVTGLVGPSVASAFTPVPPFVVSGAIPDADYTAVRALEDTAVHEVLTSHGLPNSDYNAVLAWGRSDVRGQMWNDLNHIINKQASARTPDEAAVYDWFQRVIKQQNIAAAQNAVAEYLRWSGHTSIDDTSAPLNFGPTMTYLGTPGTPTGYCNFSPPGGSDGPFKDTYHDNQAQDCYTPCTDLLTSCRPEYPTTDQFLQWGEYDAVKSTTATPGFGTASVGTAVAEGIALTAATAGLVLPMVVSIDASVLAGTALQKAIFPFAARATFQFIVKGATLASRAAASAAAEAAAGAELAGSIAFVAGVAIEFVVTTAIEIYTLVTNAEVHSQLADALSKAQTQTPDLHAMAATDDGYASLFTQFIAQTLPEPNLDCTSQFVEDPPCANAPAPPSGHTASDPSFMVTTPTSGGPHPQTAIYSIDPAGYNNNTFLSGNGWFVTTRYATTPDNASSPTTAGATNQSLSLTYKDWSGNIWTAERVTTADGHPMFAITPRDESNSGSCAKGSAGTTACLTDTIQFQMPGASGPIDATAQIAPAASLRPTASVTYSTPVDAGTAVTFTAHGTDPNNDLPLTYAWSLPNQWYNGTLTCTGPIGGPLDCTTHFTGTSPSFTFTTPGQFQGTLTVTNHSGYSSTSSFNVTARGASNTTLTSSAAPSKFGQPVTLTATVQPTSTDGNAPLFYPTVTGWVQFLVDGTAFGDPVALTAHHTIADPGADASVRLPATLPPGQHTIEADYLGAGPYKASSITPAAGQEVDKADTSTAVTASSEPTVYGQPVSFTAHVAPVAPGTGLPTGTVQFYADGQALGGPVPLDSSGAAASPSTSSLAPNFGPFSQMNVSAVYSGDADFTTSTGGLNHAVNSAPTHTAVTPSANPNVYGRATTFTATVTTDPPSTASPPTGTVQFTIDGSDVGLPVTLDGNGQASFTTTRTQLVPTGAGTAFPDGHAVSARYLGQVTCGGCIVLQPMFGQSTGGLTQQITPDTTPPTTLESESGTTGGGGWYTSAVTVTLAASDNPGGSGVTATYYSVDDASCDGSAPANCLTYGAPFVVSEGTHTVRYFSVDGAGNVEAVNTATIKVDTGPPATAIALPPPDVNGWYVSAVAPVASGTDGGSGIGDIRCQLDGAAPASYAALPSGPCPYTGTGWVVAEGIHTLYAASRDVAGNPGPVVSVVFGIDRTGPTSQVTPLSQFQSAVSFPVAWSGTDNLSGVRNYDARYRQAASGGTFGSYTTWLSHTTATSATFTAPAGSTTCFSARATDNAGWTGMWSAEQCAGEPLDDPALARIGFWTTVTGPGYFGPGVSRSTTIGNQLSTTMRGSKIGVLVTKQPGGGSIELRWNGFTQLSALLSAATVQKQQLLTFTLPSVQSGTLTIVQTGYGTVDVDGAGAYKTS